MRDNRGLNLVFSFLGALVLIFIIAPLAGMILSTTPFKLWETISDDEVNHSIALTLWVSVSATLFFSIASIPLAYLLARRNFPLKKLVLGIINLPMVIPHTAAGIAILGFLSRDSLVGSISESIGITFVGHPFGIAAAMAFVSIPFLLNAAIDGFIAVPERLEKAALNLGVSPLRVFFSISFPLAWRNILTGMIMMFSRGLSEFGAVVIIAYYPMTTPVLIFERFGMFGLKYAQPVAVVFILVTLIIFIILRFISQQKKV
jgi:molybdate/tungstate transport system permease protein